jgi:hypothetical protein
MWEGVKCQRLQRGQSENRFHNCRQLSNRNQRRTMIHRKGQGRASRAVLISERTFQLQQNCLVVKGTYVCAGAGLRRRARGCSQRTFLYRSSNAPQRRERQTAKELKTRNRKIAIWNFWKFGIVESRKKLRAAPEPIALQQAAIFLVTITSCKLALHLSPLPDAQPHRCTARTAPSQQCPQ